MAEALNKMLSLSLGPLISNIQSKFERRNAVKRISTTVLGHYFEQVLFKEPTFCSKCCDLITWEQFGDRGKRCKRCRLVCHDRCFNLIESRCARDSEHDETSVLSTTSSHKFRPTTFVKITFCQHCGILIKGLFKQGQECLVDSCKMKVHHDCKELISDHCGQKKLRPSKKQENGSRIQNNIEQDWSRNKIEDFQLIGILATGSFSKVYLAKRESGNQDRYFAIKVLKKVDPVINSDPESTLTEMRVLQFGRSYPFLTIAHCCFQSRDRLFFVMEYVEGRDLLYHITKARKFTENRTKFYSAEIVLALIFLHNRGIVYRDLKLDNVILDKHGHCKLLDFGMSKDLTKCLNQRTRTFCGTPSYISPEICEGNDYDTSVDWWSLGVLMFEMLIGYSPFDGYQNEDDLYKRIKTVQVEYPPSLSPEAKSILEGFLTKNPRQRLGCNIMDDCEQEIKKHPFFSSKNHLGCNSPYSADWWEDIEAKRIKPPYKPAHDDLLQFDNLDDDTCLTPIDSVQLKGVDQADFKGFTFYSESFDSGLNLI